MIKHFLAHTAMLVCIAVSTGFAQEAVNLKNLSFEPFPQVVAGQSGAVSAEAALKEQYVSYVLKSVARSDTTFIKALSENRTWDCIIRALEIFITANQQYTANKERVQFPPGIDRQKLVSVYTSHSGKTWDYWLGIAWLGKLTEELGASQIILGDEAARVVEEMHTAFRPFLVGN